MSKPSVLAEAERLAPSMNNAMFSWGGDMLASLVIETNSVGPAGHNRRNPSQSLFGSTRGTAQLRYRRSATPAPGPRENGYPFGAASGCAYQRWAAAPRQI